MKHLCAHELFTQNVMQNIVPRWDVPSYVWSEGWLYSGYSRPRGDCEGPGEMLKTNCCIDQIRTFLISTSARDTGPWRAGGAICKYAARPEMIYVLKFRFEVKSPNTHENSSSFHTTMRIRTDLCDFLKLLLVSKFSTPLFR